MNIWLVGHGGFYNKGCEAIVRSTVAMLSTSLPRVRCLLWSSDATNDSRQISGSSIQITSELHSMPVALKQCACLRRKLGNIGRFAATLYRTVMPGVPQCVLSIGGDNFTLDYGPPQNFIREGLWTMDAGIPFVIWGASIGPFSAEPELEKEMASFLAKVRLITAREGATVEYLRSIGVEHNVVRVWDPAFALGAEQYQGDEADFVSSGNVLGFNISALIARWFPGNDIDRMLDDVAIFLAKVIETGIKVLLIPHVTRLGGEIVEDDERFLKMVQERLRGSQKSLRLLSGNVPARQIKWIISKCRFLIAARTHATIAGLSTGVPTIAIAYSQKAKGIWQDVFGNDEYLLKTDCLNNESLWWKLEKLKKNELSIRQLLAGRHKEMVNGALENARTLLKALGRV